MYVAGLECRVAGIGDDAQVGFGPRPMQVPGAAHRTDDVVATLHDHRRNSSDGPDIVEQLPLPAEEIALILGGNALALLRI